MDPSLSKSYLRVNIRSSFIDKYLHIEGYLHSSIEVANEYFAHVRHEGFLCDHAIAVHIKQLEQPLTYNPRQAAVLDKGHLVEALFFEVLLSIGNETTESQILVEVA
jgi:hypothetical protein